MEQQLAHDWLASCHADIAASLGKFIFVFLPQFSAFYKSSDSVSSYLITSPGD
jgi:hypothetical protein